MRQRITKRPKWLYFLLLVPLGLAYLSWTFFPILARWIVTAIFHYGIIETANPVWYGTAIFFYAWYSFLAIGVAGMWVIAATLARWNQTDTGQARRPSVSFIIPAFNEEKTISRCLTSIFRCAKEYRGNCQIIVVDDGSTDLTYEIAWGAIQEQKRTFFEVPAKVVRHSANLGKAEAVRTGANAALGETIAIVDADSWWMSDTLTNLVECMMKNKTKAVTGYIRPSDGKYDPGPYILLQQLEYSQGLGMSRCAESLGSNVLIVAGAMGLYDARVLQNILFDKRIESVTEDLEITLELHKMGAGVGYASLAKSVTMAPESLKTFWRQRLRWFKGFLHNMFGIHRDILGRKSWISFLLWYTFIFEYVAAFVDLASLVAFPFLFWFAPDRIFFVASLLIFVPYALALATVVQALALRYAYGESRYRALILYTPFFPILWLINTFARVTSSLRYLTERGRS